MISTHLWADDAISELDTVFSNKPIITEKAWGLDFDLGFGLARGNTDYTTIEGDFLTFKKISPLTFYLIADLNYRESSGKKDTNSAELTLRTDYQTNTRWGWTFLDTVGHNEFTKIRISNLIGLGPLYSIIYERLKNLSSLMLAYDYEKYQDYTYKNRAVMILRNEFLFRLNQNTSFALDFSYTPMLNEFSDFRLKLRPKIETKIYQDCLAFFVALKAEHHSKPELGVRKNDFQITTGLAFKAN
jgi:putative salt-induced outer membrane protein YdiY